MAALVIAAAPARGIGVAPPTGLAASDTIEVRAVLDGNTIELLDGRVARLSGIESPRAGAIRRADGTRLEQPPRHAETALAALALGRRVILYYDRQRTDRYGRELAHVYRDDGLWLEGELLARGLARVMSQADNRALVPAMLAAEAEARAARRGIWSERRFAVLTPAEARRHVERFELVEGRVERVSQTSGPSYLHFGADPRATLTAILLPESRRMFRAAALSPDSFADKTIRVRGFIRWRGGPVIEVTHPEQIELLTP